LLSGANYTEVMTADDYHVLDSDVAACQNQNFKGDCDQIAS